MRRPNVVFIIADQHRWDFMGYESNGVTRTPILSGMGREGTIFRAAYCTSPLCTPSRAAIASGRYGMNSGAFTNLHELPPGTPGFVPQFHKAGYRTCAVGKTHMEIHAYHSDYVSEDHMAYMRSLGWDETFEISGNGMLKTGISCAYTRFLEDRGMLDKVLDFYRRWHYFMDTERRGDPGHVCHEWPFEEDLQETAFVANTALQWLRGRDRSRPFLLHVGFAGPHEPIEPFGAFMTPYRNDEQALPWGRASAPPWYADSRRGYRAMITQIDHHVGRIRDLLSQQGELDNTVFVYTADHGDMMGDHGLWGKTNFYEAAMRVPLILAGPGIRPGQDSRALVELLDIGKTLCELCGVESHSLDQGKSLVPVLSGDSETHRDTVYAEMGCDRMLLDGRYKLMWGDPLSDTRKLGRLHLDKPVAIPPSPPRLYDLQKDPTELRDLARSDGGVLREMLEKLLARINQNIQPLPNKSRGEYKPRRSSAP